MALDGVRQRGENLRCIHLLLLLTDSRALARKAIQPNGAQLSQQHEQLKDAACLLRAGQVQYGGKQTVSLLVIYSATGLRVRPFFTSQSNAHRAGASSSKIGW